MKWYIVHLEGGAKLNVRMDITDDELERHFADGSGYEVADAGIAGKVFFHWAAVAAVEQVRGDYE